MASVTLQLSAKAVNHSSSSSIHTNHKKALATGRRWVAYKLQTDKLIDKPWSDQDEHPIGCPFWLARQRQVGARYNSRQANTNEPPLLQWRYQASGLVEEFRVWCLLYGLSSNRMFISADGTRFEWRRLSPADPTAYDVLVFVSSLILMLMKIVAYSYTWYLTCSLHSSDGRMRKLQVSSAMANSAVSRSDWMAVGISWGYLSFTFDNDRVLLESLLALTVNRWIDMYRQWILLSCRIDIRRVSTDCGSTNCICN